MAETWSPPWMPTAHTSDTIGQNPGLEESENRPAEAAQDDSLREALRFLGPCLAQFSLTPSHAMLYFHPSLRPDKDCRLSIFRHEKDNNLQGAVDDFIDWLLTIPSPRLPAFFNALQQGTEEHRRVYGLLVVCGIYLPVHQQLVTVLTEKLQEGWQHLSFLVQHLIEHDLLLPEHREKVVRKFIQWVNTQDKNVSEENAHNSTEAAQPQADEDSSQTGRPQSEGGSKQNEQPGREDESVTEEFHSEDSADLPTSPVDAELVVKVLVACLYYRQVDVLTSGRASAEGRRETTCERFCSGAAGDSRLPTRRSWTDHLKWVLTSETTLGDVASCLPNDVTSLKLWTVVRERFRRIMNLPLVETAENETGEMAHVSCAQGTDATGPDADDSGRDSANTVRYISNPIKICDDNLDTVREKRTQDYVTTQGRIVTKGLVDYDAMSEYSEALTISTISNNNPLGQPPLQPRTSGVLQQEEKERLKKGEITLRPYQEELLFSARQGKNGLIWLPTGTGKTYLVLKYAQEHLMSQSAGERRRVAFVVPRVRLAQQQHERFELFLPQFKPYLRCGETAGTTSAKIPWQNLLEMSSIFVMTAECLVKAVEQEYVTLSDFTLLVLDECHHARGGHPLRNLMNLYMDVKFGHKQRNGKLPQIMGLTASPGVGGAKGKESPDKAALDYLRQLCARLDVEEICSVRKNKDDLAQYVYEPKHQMLQSEKRKRDRFKEQVEAFMKQLEKLMYTHGDVERYVQAESGGREHLQRELAPPESHRGDSQYTEWVHGLENKLMKVKNEKAYYVLAACADMLKLLQRALILNEDCESWQALDFLKKEVKRRRTEKPESAYLDHHLFDQFEDQIPRLELVCPRDRSRNPKLKLLKKIILTSTRVQEEEEQEPDVERLDGRTLNIQATSEPQAGHPQAEVNATDTMEASRERSEHQETLRKTVDEHVAMQEVAGDPGTPTERLNDHREDAEDFRDQACRIDGTFQTPRQPNKKSLYTYEEFMNIVGNDDEPLDARDVFDCDDGENLFVFDFEDEVPFTDATFTTAFDFEDEVPFTEEDFQRKLLLVDSWREPHRRHPQNQRRAKNTRGTSANSRGEKAPAHQRRQGNRRQSAKRKKPPTAMTATGGRAAYNNQEEQTGSGTPTSSQEEQTDGGTPDNIPDHSETHYTQSIGDGKLLNDGTMEIPDDDLDLEDSNSELESVGWEMDSNVRGMIFVRTLDLSQALVEWIKNDPKLFDLNPGRITGVNASVKDGGMTKSEVTDVMSNFNAGVHKLVVCTSAAEEGLDFTACNLVIRYDYVTSMVSMIQTRGRARQKDSRYCVMGDLTSGSMAKEQANLASELIMREAVASFQNEVDSEPGRHRDVMLQLQREAFRKRWSKETAEARRDSKKLPEARYVLLCGGCKKHACTSHMIRLLRRTNRVVVGASFRERYEPEKQEGKQNIFDKELLPTGESVHCKYCGMRWGIILQSTKDNLQFPVITIRSFCIMDEHGEVHMREKWSQAFDVPELTEDDSKRHVQPYAASQESAADDVGH